MSADDETEHSDLLHLVGMRVHHSRTDLGWSRRQLAERSGVSQRYLAQLEAGRGNVSIVLLHRIAQALNSRVEWLVGESDPPGDEVSAIVAMLGDASAEQLSRIRSVLRSRSGEASRYGRIALIGLRGAGKSTIGPLLADALSLPFAETNEEIEKITGIGVNEVIAMYGQEGYRTLERRALERFAEYEEPVIVAAAGGIVSEADSFDFLLDSFHSVWLKATPDEHMNRVREQGDMRPMAGNPAAMDELESILTSREAHYQRAEIVIDTSGKTEIETLNDLVDALKNRAIIA